jgi:RNA polymerase sigma factor (sigma-70 family)
VFVILAEKATELVESKHDSISGWLFHVMHLTCARLRRSRQRQSQRESTAGTLLQQDRRALPEGELLVLLEDAIWQLPPIDREAVVRRFYQQQDLASIGEALGISAEAARKRISRALDQVRTFMLQDGIDAIPDELLDALEADDITHPTMPHSARNDQRINSIAKGTMTMVAQMDAMDFTVWTVEFFVKDVEANLDFFEKLGFRRHFLDTPDAMGRLPRASLRGGKTARIWLRRADETENTRPNPGAFTIFLWIDGGHDGLAAHRNAISAQGVQVSQYFDDIGLRNFTVTSPDGYAIGFFTAHK